MSKRYETISIKKLVKEINDVYFLPDIQRPFVWKDSVDFDEKVIKLFDSILRNYPIGTLLFWEIDKNKVKEDKLRLLKFFNNSNDTINDEFNSLSPDKTYFLVLDGQQRMTVLNLIFNGKFNYFSKKKEIYKTLYFNLLTDFERTENEYSGYEFKFFDENQGEYFLDEEHKLWFKVKEIIDLKLTDLEDKFEEIYKFDFNFDNDKKKLIRKNLVLLLSAVTTDDNISYFKIEKEKEDTDALEIFVRVNSQGMVLTYSDLLFSKIVQYWKKDSAENVKNIFSQFLNGDENKGEIKGINRYGDRFNFNNDFILKTALVLFVKEIRYNLKNFTEENIKLIKDNWYPMTESIRKVVEFLPKIGITSKKYLRSLNAIIPIIYFIYKNKLYNQAIDESTNHNKILYEKFIYTVLLNGVFGGQSDQLLKGSRDIISKDNSGNFPINELFKYYEQLNKKIRTGEELQEFIDDIKYNTDKSKIVLKILYGNLMDDKTQEDHLFPQTKTKKAHPKLCYLVDNISNLQALKTSNQKKKDKDFDMWFSEISVNVPNFREISYIPLLDSEEIDEELKSIGKLVSYKSEYFETFIKRRKILIYRKLKDYFKF